MTKLAETYMHFKIEASADFVREAEKFLYDFAHSVSSDLFEQETRIYIRYENGSWKTWVTVAGALYIGIGQYGSFRSGIDYIAKDSKRFSNTVIEQFVGTQKIDESVIFRTERRLGIPGKIQRLFDRIDKIKAYNREYPTEIGKVPRDEYISESELRMTSSIDEESKKIKHEILKIFNALENENDKNLFVRELSETISINELPSPKPELDSASRFDGFPPHQLMQFAEEAIKQSESPKSAYDGFPLQGSPSLPSENVLTQHREAVIREENEVERLKKIIKSSRFQLKIG